MYKRQEETSVAEKNNSKKNKDYGENVSDVDFAKLSESESDETLKSMHQLSLIHI